MNSSHVFFLVVEQLFEMEVRASPETSVYLEHDL